MPGCVAEGFGMLGVGVEEGCADGGLGRLGSAVSFKLIVCDGPVGLGGGGGGVGVTVAAAPIFGAIGDAGIGDDGAGTGTPMPGVDEEV